MDTSPIFVGIIDRDEIADPPEKIHHNDNKIGGYPVFCKDYGIEEICCANCKFVPAFIFQISCPVDLTFNDRLLYFFACINPKCSKQEFFIFRVIINSTDTQPEKWDKLFDDDEWGTETDINELSQTLNEELCLDKSCPLKDEYNYFKSHYIYVFEEPIKESTIGQKEKKKIEDITKTCLEEKGGGEEYEKEYSTAFKDDKTNYLFYKRLRRCPEQIIRYQWAGKPLHSTDNVQVKPTPCENCGAMRVFEMQLMPALIGILIREKRSNREAFDFNFETILVYTCGNNCVNPNKKIHKEQLFVFKENYKLN